jgi:hypothetical protein
MMNGNSRISGENQKKDGIVTGIIRDYDEYLVFEEMLQGGRVTLIQDSVGNNTCPTTNKNG